MNPYRNNDLKSFIESIPKEEIEANNNREKDQAIRDFERFKAAVNRGLCIYCAQTMDSFDPFLPCLHWFTYPNGIRKKHFEKYLAEPLSLFQLESYFRWLASTEKIIGNINDSVEELSRTSLLEITVRYRDIEWSISLGRTDADGHEGSRSGSIPHYHIQMLVGGKIFIKFSDFHIPLTDPDLLWIELTKQVPDLVERVHIMELG